MFDLKRFKIRSKFNEIIKPGVDIIFKDIEEVVIHNQFLQSPKDFIILAQVKWKKVVKDPVNRLNEVNSELDWFNEINVVSHDKKDTLGIFQGSYDPSYTEIFNITMREYHCFLEFPIHVTNEFGVLYIVGPPQEVKRLLEFLGEWGSLLEVIGVRNYSTTDIGILSVLTERQREVLQAAYDHGFFDMPKRMDSRGIASKIGVSHATFIAHIRKSEKRMFSALLDA